MKNSLIINILIHFACLTTAAAPSDAIFGDRKQISIKPREFNGPKGENHLEVEIRHDFVHERGPHFEGDIILSPGQLGGASNVRKWTNKQIPYIIDSRLSSSERNVITQAISEIHGKTCIRLVTRSSHQNYVKFAKAGKGCWSYIGMVGNEQVISLDNGCYTKHTVVHEIIHAIGFWHEQSRKDRDDFVNINWNNIPQNQQYNFNKRTDTVDFGYGYEYAGIMHYSAYAFASNPNIPTITAKKDFPIRDFGKGDGKGGMTSWDAAQINRMYGC